MNAKKMAQKCLSMLLVLCMVAGLIVVPAHAAESKTTFNYVSLGASNTNGYGMRGYITEEELDLLLSGAVSKDEVNVYGYERKPEGAYPDLIRDYYVDTYGSGNVNINQLAISSMRVEELRILLDDTYMGDDYSQWRFTGSDGWFNSAEPGGISALRAAYKEHITNADLITVDIGWNNFGVYVCNQLVDYMSNGRLKWTADVTQIFDTAEEDEAALEAKKIIGAYIAENVSDEEFAAVLTDIFSYSILGYMHNFDICMDKIYELNPDADVVVLGIQNLLHGVVVELNGKTMALGDLFGNFVNMANYYASARSPYQSEYQYVKVGSNEHVTIFLDFMKTYNGDAENLNQNVKDCFDYYDNDLFIQTRIDYMAAALIEEEYGSALSFIGYDSAEDVVADGKKGNLPSVGDTDLQEIFDSMYWPALYAAYDTLAELVKEIANFKSVVADDLLAGNLSISEREDAMMTALEDEITENAMAAANGEAYTVDLDKVMKDKNDEIVAAMYIRYYMGNSFFAHPNEDGHKEIRDAVVGVIKNPASEKDQALSEKLVKSVEDIHELLCGAAGHEQIFTSSSDATCEEPGKVTTSCACGKEVKESASEKLPHAYTAGEAVWAEDYTSCSITFTCSKCEGKQVETDATIASETTKKAACEVAGEIIYTADFGESELVEQAVTTTVVIPALEHQYESVVTDPTCTEDGFTTHTCSVCGHFYTDSTVATTGHSWDEGTVTKEPTETETGTCFYTCTVCGETKEEVLPATHQHEYTSVVTDPTCTEAGYTTYTCECGHSYVGDEVEATGHTEVVDEAVAATCLDNGLTEGKHCSVCELVIVAQEEVPATDHTWDAGTVITKPTEEQNGLVRYSCTYCGEVKEVEVAYGEVIISRISGADRFATSLAAAQQLKQVLGVDSFDTIIIASGENFADALTGSYLATVKGAPILLHNDSVMEQNLEFISENLARRGTVYILGGTSSVSETMEQNLESSRYNVVRLAGADRFETNLKILEEAGVTNEELLVCTADTFADSLSASAVGLPILLVNNKTGELTEGQTAFLEGLEDNNITIIGGVNSVSEKLEKTLTAYGTVGRIAGASREETSVLVAEEYFEAVDCLVLADSRNYPDGLCGGTLAHALKAPLVLIASGTEKAATEYVAGEIIETAIILGGTASVTDESVRLVFSLN